MLLVCHDFKHWLSHSIGEYSVRIPEEGVNLVKLIAAPLGELLAPGPDLVAAIKEAMALLGEGNIETVALYVEAVGPIGTHKMVRCNYQSTVVCGPVLRKNFHELGDDGCEFLHLAFERLEILLVIGAAMIRALDHTLLADESFITVGMFVLGVVFHHIGLFA